MLKIKDSKFPSKPLTHEKWLVFDLESDGLYDQVTKVFCIVVYHVQLKQTLCFGPDVINDALEYLATADVFDWP